MTWFDMLTLSVAALATLECVAGRLGAMHWAEHRPSLLLGYLVAAGVCILAESMIWQGADARWLDMAAWAVAVHLGASRRAWKAGAPPDALRQPPLQMLEVAPSRIDQDR